MKTFEFTSPNGKTYEVTGPDNATEAQAFQMLQQQLGKPQTSLGDDLLKGAGDFGAGLIAGASNVGRGVLALPKLVGAPPIGGQEWHDRSARATKDFMEGRGAAGTAGEFVSEVAGTAGFGGPIARGASLLPNALRLIKGGAGRATAEGALGGAVLGQGDWEDVGIGAAGGWGGERLLKGVGKLLGGARQTPEAEALRRRGIDVTAGQGSPGGIVKYMEEASQYIPGPANAVRQQRAAPYQQFRDMLVKDAMPHADPLLPGPVGPRSMPRGNSMDEVLTNARAEFQQHYDNVLKGKVFDEDAVFAKELGDMSLHSPHVLGDSQLRSVVQYANDQLNPGRRAGGWTGEQLSIIRRNLDTKAATLSNPEQSAWLRDVSDNLLEMMARQHPEVGKVHATLAGPYKHLRTLERAAESEVKQGNFGVAALANAADQTGNQMMRRIGREAATVLHDDLNRGGMGVRTAIGAGALLGGLGASGYYGGGPGLTSTLAVPGAMYGLMGTKTGQKFLAGQYGAQKRMAELLRKHPTAGSSTGAAAAVDLLQE